MTYYVVYRRGQCSYYRSVALIVHEWLSDPSHYFNKEMQPSDCFMMIPLATWNVE